MRTKLSNWERYLHEAGEIDPLIRMAVMHYQFEAIHPFTDGNGRTGRVLNLLFLVEKGLIDIPVLYLSRYIIQNKADYYRLLLHVTVKSQWEDWILYMLEAVRSTAQMDDTARSSRPFGTCSIGRPIRCANTAPKIYSRELAEIVFVQPYCRIGDLVRANIANDSRRRFTSRPSPNWACCRK